MSAPSFAQAHVQALVYKTTPQGLNLQIDVHSPPGDASTQPAPVILWLHGGGLFFGDRSDVSFPQWLARASREKGWTVVSADYRLLPESTIDDVLSDIKDAWIL